MPLLHMETDQVRGAGRQLGTLAATLQSEGASLSRSAQNLSGVWLGGSSDIFAGEMAQLLRSLAALLDQGSTLSQRLEREVVEWETVDGTAGGGSGVGPATHGDFGSADSRSGSVTDDAYIPPGMEGIVGWKSEWGSPGEDDMGEFSAVVYGDEASWGVSKDSILGGQMGAGAAARYTLGFDDDGFEANAEAVAEAYLWKEQLLDEQFGIFDARADATVGAHIGGEAQLEINPFEGDVELEAEVGGFAGVSAGGELGTVIGPVGAAVGGQIGLGVGAGAHADVGFDDWKFNLDFGAHAFVGIGGGLDYEVTVDIPELVRGAVDIGETVVNITDPLRPLLL